MSNATDIASHVGVQVRCIALMGAGFWIHLYHITPTYVISVRCRLQSLLVLKISLVAHS